MSIDVTDLLRGNIGLFQRFLHRPARTTSRRIGLGKVMIVRGNSVADNFPQNLRATRARTFKILERKDGSSFAKHHARTVYVDRPAFFRRCSRQRIYTEKD